MKLKKIERTLIILITLILLTGLISNNIVLADSYLNTSTNTNINGEISLKDLATAELSDSVIPEAIDKSSLKQNNCVKRLYEQETDLNSVVFQNRDGSKSIYSFGEPIKYIDENGKVKDKSNELTSEITNKKYKSEYAYCTKDNDIKSYYPTELSKTDGIVLNYKDYSITMTPSYVSNVASYNEKTINSKSSKAEKIDVENEDGEIIEYEGVFGAKTKLHYTPTFKGFKENIILNNKNENNNFSFIIDAGNLDIVDEDGYIYFYNKLTGEPVAQINPIFIYDSAITPNESYNNKFLVEKQEDGKYLVTIVADTEFLNDENTVYPVYVDPSILFISDPYIEEAAIYSNGGDTTFGSRQTNNIGYYNRLLGVGRLLVKFPGVTNNSIYQYLNGAQITNAYYIANCDSDNNSTTICPYIYTSEWTESTISYNTANWSGYESLAGLNSVTVPNSTGYVLFDITTAVKAWKNGVYNEDTGIMLINNNESDSLYNKCFTSTEYGDYYGSNMPYVLIICDPNITLNLNETYDYFPIYSIEGPINEDVYFTSADTNIASVGYTSGLITGNCPGITTITIRYTDDNYIYSTFNVSVILPTSGYEIEYNPDLWNYQPVLSGCNCYSYALNNQTKPNSNSLWFMQPGDDDYIVIENIDYANNLITAVQTDAVELKFTFESISGIDPCNVVGSYKVALVADSYDYYHDLVVSYHWYRQNPDGTWSHKPGITAATNLDASGNVIYDPLIADRDYNTDGHRDYNFSTFVGYFMVTPLNNMYTP